MPFRVGLTGGIGCGKSTVTKLFSSLGIPIVDSDQIARDLVKPGTPALTEIIQAFGQDVLLSDGQLDRSSLRRRIFNHPEDRKRLESILHPRIRSELQIRSEHAQGPYVVLVIPLLIESGLQALVDRILVVDCAPETQIKRIMARDHASEVEVRAILKAQVTREVRLSQADEIIYNEDHDLPTLKDQVVRIDRDYRQRAINFRP